MDDVCEDGAVKRRELVEDRNGGHGGGTGRHACVVEVVGDDGLPELSEPELERRPRHMRVCDGGGDLSTVDGDFEHIDSINVSWYPAVQEGVCVCVCVTEEETETETERQKET